MSIIINAITIRQPWAWLIAAGHKTVENRTWTTKHRGPLLIHAGLSLDDEGYRAAERLGIVVPDVARGAVVGIVDLIGIDRSDMAKVWPSTPWDLPNASHWQLRRAAHLPTQGVTGRQSIFPVELTRRETIDAVNAWAYGQLQGVSDG